MKEKLKKLNVSEVVPFLGLVFVIIVFQIITKGKLLSASNLRSFPNYLFQIIVPACGYIFLMSQGNMDFSLAGMVCISTAIGALVSKTSIQLSVVVVIVMCIIMGLLNAFVTIELKINSFVATIATSFVYSDLASVILGGGAITADYDYKLADKTWLKYGIIILCVVISYIIYNYTPFGKNCRSMGANSTAAYQAGVKTKKTKYLAFSILAFTCSLVSLFLLIRTCTGSTNSGLSTQINTMLALLLGGIPFSGGWSSKFKSVVIGSLMMAVISNGLILINMSSEAQQILKGLLFIAAVAISFDRKNTAVIK